MEFTEAMLQAYLAAAYLTEPDTKKHTIVSTGEIGGKKISYGVSSMQGWRSTMEDAHVHKIGLQDTPDMAVFGVFDGHGGDLAALFCEHSLIPYIENSEYFINMNGNPSGKPIGLTLTETFMEIDEDMRQVDAVIEGRDESGSTGVVVSLTNDEVIIANTGDSRMILVRDGKPVFATEDHKPFNPPERTRIERAGGVVEMDRVNGDLASARSFGDFMYKRDTTRPANQQMISVQPDVTILDRNENDQFILLACDGVWDVFSNEDAALFVQTTMELGCGVGRCCELLIEESLERDSRDNISVIIVALPGAPSELGQNKPGSKPITIDDTIEAMKKLNVNRRRSKPPVPKAWVVNREIMSTTIPSKDELSATQVENFGNLMGSDWNDFDETQHKIGIILGVFPEDSRLLDLKYLFWTTNPLTEKLTVLLTELCEVGGPLQHRDAEHQYRYVPNLI